MSDEWRPANIPSVIHEFETLAEAGEFRRQLLSDGAVPVGEALRTEDGMRWYFCRSTSRAVLNTNDTYRSEDAPERFAYMARDDGGGLFGDATETEAEASDA